MAPRTPNPDKCFQISPLPTPQQGQNLAMQGDKPPIASSIKPSNKNPSQAARVLGQKAKQSPPDGPLEDRRSQVLQSSTVMPGVQEPARKKAFTVMRDESNVIQLDDSPLPPPNALYDKTNLSTTQSSSKRASDLQKPMQSLVKLNMATDMNKQTASLKRKNNSENLTGSDHKRNRFTSPPETLDHSRPEFRVNGALTESPHTTISDPVSDSTATPIPETIKNVMGGGKCISGNSEQVSKATTAHQSSVIDSNKAQEHAFTSLDHDVQVDPQHLQQDLQLLCSIVYDASKLREEDKRYVPLPPDIGRHALNEWLNKQIREVTASSATFFRDLDMPSKDDISLLARCIRFSHSDAQREVDWRVREAHVIGIRERTNVYGLELLGTRTNVNHYECDGTQQAVEVLTGIRFVQRYPHLHLVAADIPDITTWLYRRPRFMLEEVFTVQDKLKYLVVFSAVTEYCRRRWPTWKPDIRWNLGNGGDLPSSSSELIEQYLKEVAAYELDVAARSTTGRTSPPVDHAILKE